MFWSIEEKRIDRNWLVLTADVLNWVWEMESLWRHLQQTSTAERRLFVLTAYMRGQNCSISQSKYHKGKYNDVEEKVVECVNQIWVRLMGQLVGLNYDIKI